MIYCFDNEERIIVCDIQDRNLENLENHERRQTSRMGAKYEQHARASVRSVSLGIREAVHATERTFLATYTSCYFRNSKLTLLCVLHCLSAHSQMYTRVKKIGCMHNCFYVVIVLSCGVLITLVTEVADYVTSSGLLPIFLVITYNKKL